MIRIFAALLLAALAAGCASSLSGDYAGDQGKTLKVGAQMWGYYEEYVAAIQNTNPGAFAYGVMDGEAVYATYVSCPAGHCIANTNDASRAIQMCHDKVKECVLFARGSTIVVNYKREGQ